MVRTKESLEFRRNMLSMFCNLLGVPFGPMAAVSRPQDRDAANQPDVFPLLCKQPSGSFKMMALSLLSS